MNLQDAPRTVYRDHLTRLMRSNPSVVCVDTDTGIFKVADFGGAAEHYVNMGIAEQNAMGVAAGLAASGWRPYINTMAAFAATRAAETVKLDIAYNGLPVRIVATHSGVAAGHFGPTHHALEDLAVMRTLPNMTVLVPGDAMCAASLLEQMEHCPGPVYLRLGRKATPSLPRPADPTVIGRLQEMCVVGDAADAVIVAAGPLPVLRALDAAELLSRAGLQVAVLQAHTLKPFDAATLLRRCAPARLVVTLEEHWRTGGLGSAVAEVIAEVSGPPVLRLGFPDAFVTRPGTQEELVDAADLSASGIAVRVQRRLHPSSLRGVS